MTGHKAVKLPDVLAGVSAEWPEDYASKPRKSNKYRRPHREKVSTAPFIAWDGEGWSDHNDLNDAGIPNHHTMLFGNSLGEKVTGRSLTWRECFPLLLESRTGINVIFGGDYDIIMMIKSMPFKTKERLFAGDVAKYGGYRMQWFRRKFFRLSEVTPIDGKYRRSTTLYDVHSFFQCSFVKACIEYLGDDETLQEMHRQKLRRDSFTLDDATVDAYWQSELNYLVRLMNVLRELLAEVNIKPRGWYGPGAVASALMSKHKMKPHYETPIPEHIVDIGERAYYGGRFEQFKVGKFDSVYEYDIRSAYPKIISELPDLANVEWNRRTYREDEFPERINPFGLYNVSWDIKFLPTVIGPLPWRDSQGRIFFPLKGSRSWYWGIEILRCLTQSFPKPMYSIHESYVPVPTADNDSGAFGWVKDMYNDRARMKAEGNPAQKALKLGLNSLYGKLAQSAGTRKTEDGWVKPQWLNVLWAGYITAATRAKMFLLAKRDPTALVAIETDAVFSMRPLPDVKLGEELGQLELTTIDQMLYVHSGVYYAQSDGVWRLKSRGVEADRSKNADDWLEIFSQLPHKSLDITLRIRRFGTDIRQPDRFGRWYDYQTSTNMPNAFSKRVHGDKLCLVCIANPTVSYADGYHWLVVPQSLLESDWQSSQPYKFPWRDDVKYDWNGVDGGEWVENTEDMVWT